MCEKEGKEQRQRTSFDYGYDPFGDRTSTPGKLFHRRAFSDRREYKRSNNSDDTPYGSIAKRRRTAPHPIFDGYQLVGDSLLLRFAEQVLFERCIYENGMRYLGLCVSGQTIEDLIRRVEDKFSPVGEKIILLIGTNNMIQQKNANEMSESLKKLLDLLDRTAKKIVLLTAPPIPKLESSGSFWYKFNHYNGFIRSLSERKNVIVQDISNLYLDKNKECRMEYFEEWYDRSHRRPDLIHLNRAGLLQIRDYLRQSMVLESSDDDSNEDSDEDSNEDSGSTKICWKPNLDSD